MADVGTRCVQGSPCWASLMARDLDTACRFYGPLLGWEFGPGPTHMGPYVRALVDGEPVAGIGVLEQRLGFPVAWTTYFAADSADEVAQRVREYGGTVAVGPLDAEKAGRLVIGADLFGAVFGIWEGLEHPGWNRHGEPGSVAWCELHAQQVQGSAAFYAGAFGMAAVERRPDWAELLAGGAPVAWISGRGVDPLSTPRWRVCFAVADVDAAAERAVQLGGSVLQPPHDRPHGRVAVLRDREGEDFSVTCAAASPAAG
jgi:hypothetical protein